MRKEYINLNQNNRYRRTRLRLIRESENWISKSSKIILNIAYHENYEFRNNRNYHQAEFFPLSWPDEAVIHRQRNWMSDGILRLLHLGSIDGFIGFDSLKYILCRVFPLLNSDIRRSIELFVIGKNYKSKFYENILNLS